MGNSTEIFRNFKKTYLLQNLILDFWLSATIFETGSNKHFFCVFSLLKLSKDLP